ncbi:FecR family protein [Phytopseudomonas punonensis]|uniref:FecR family protein n=1 Tax=Phytopseudomonas punonensis TaxID=1220495 RepID=A0A1M7NSX1_9GAMM|nr:FecR domain-containing protein [Pseudomonas punonensis]SHN07162.1 FecR family protein [Pseudomonas punonensis]
MSARRREAAHWFARLLELPDEHPERQLFANWLAADPRNAQEFHSFKRLWGDFSSTDQTRALAGAMENVGRRRLLRNGMLGGLLLGGLGSLLLVRNAARQELQLFTGIGQLRRMKLADGSEVQMDADTRIQVLFDERVRHLTLLRGRAIFDVRHNPQRPFVVDAGAAQVRVLGTRFVVERFDRRVQVSVARGRVEMAGGGQRIELTADQVGLYGESRGLVRSDRKAAGAFGFSTGSLVFEQADLGEVAAGLSRYRDKPLRLELPPSQQTITAVVQISDVEAFVQALPQLAGIRVQERADSTLVLPR